MRLLAPFLGKLENRIFFPACTNCLVAVVDSTTFLHCEWAKVGVHEALTEKNDNYYRRNVILTARQCFGHLLSKKERQKVLKLLVN